MSREEALEVRLADREPPVLVGRLLDVGQGPHFEYDPAFRSLGLGLAPLALPLQAEPFGPGPRALHRLRGLFADSVPDGWGLKVLHQALRQAGTDPLRASSLTLLRAIGLRGMGALTYHPPAEIWGAIRDGLEVEELAAAAARLDADELDEVPMALRRVTGSSGGVRPKLTLAWNDDGRVHDPALPLRIGFRHVLAKFRARTDPPELPAIEHAYLLMARAAGLVVPDSRVHRLRGGESALVVDRFDRIGDARRHVQTLAALLEVDPANDIVDYAHLLDVARRITGGHGGVVQAFRLAAFNVLARNRDDHARNIAFLMSPAGEWSLAPAYDLTWSAAGAYHAMSVVGESHAPGREDLERLGRSSGLEAREVRELLDEVASAVGRWREFADVAGLASRWRSRIGRDLGVGGAGG